MISYVHKVEQREHKSVPSSENGIHTTQCIKVGYKEMTVIRRVLKNDIQVIEADWS